jgi:hypothetical protein
MVDRLSPIDRRLKRPQASETQQPKAEDADACASDGAIGDNGSTLVSAQRPVPFFGAVGLANAR